MNISYIVIELQSFMGRKGARTQGHEAHNESWHQLTNPLNVILCSTQSMFVTI
jgi:hypothetical protein